MPKLPGNIQAQKCADLWKRNQWDWEAKEFKEERKKNKRINNGKSAANKFIMSIQRLPFRN